MLGFSLLLSALFIQERNSSIPFYMESVNCFKHQLWSWLLPKAYQRFFFQVFRTSLSRTRSKCFLSPLD